MKTPYDDGGYSGGASFVSVTQAFNTTTSMGRLTLNEEEARIVQHIFERYLELESVMLLAKDLKVRGGHSKFWVTQKGVQRGGGCFGRGALYALLKNPIYLGNVSHKGRTYQGERQAILFQKLWDRVQKKLHSNCRREGRGPSKSSQSLLFNDQGNPMSPAHAKKKNGKRYRYYVSQSLIRGQPDEAGSVARVPPRRLKN